MADQATFLLITLNVVYVLTTPKPEETEDETLELGYDPNSILKIIGNSN